MTRVDRDKSDELYITVGGETYYQSYILDAASLVDVDVEHFDINAAKTLPGFEMCIRDRPRASSARL